MKKLIELDPEFIGYLRTGSGEGIAFDCPACPPEKGHRLVAYFSNPIDGKEVGKHATLWKREGGFGVVDLTLDPSINYPCFHGWVEGGAVISIDESSLYLVTHVIQKGTPPAEDAVIGVGSSLALSPRQSKKMLEGKLQVRIDISTVPDKAQTNG